MIMEQTGKSIEISLDVYVMEVMAEYSEYIKISLGQMKVQISLGVSFTAEDAPVRPVLPNRLK